MDKTIQDNVWRSLPSEFRMEVRELYAKYSSGSRMTHYAYGIKEALEILFGDILISDADPENVPEHPKSKFKIGDRVRYKKVPDLSFIIEDIFPDGKLAYCGTDTDGIFRHSMVNPEYVELCPPPTDKAEENELDLTDLLKIGDEVYSPICGECKLTEFRNGIITVQECTNTDDYPDTYRFLHNGYYHPRGRIILYPSLELYQQYPLDAAKAWAVWAKQHKPKYNLHCKIFIGEDGDLSHCFVNETHQLPSQHQAEYVASQIRKVLARCQEGGENG